MLKRLLKLFATLVKKKRVLTKTRVQLYRQMKTKPSQSLPPDEKLYAIKMLQAIKCILYEVYYWSRVDEAIINDIFCKIMV